MYHIFWFRACLELCFTDLFLIVEGLEVFLEETSEVICVLRDSVGHKSCINIPVSCGGISVSIPLAEVWSIKYRYSFFPVYPFFIFVLKVLLHKCFLQKR